MDQVILFFDKYNDGIALGSMAVLTVVFIIVMVISEWRRDENWWRA